MSQVRLTYQGLDEFVRNLTSRVNDSTGNFTYLKLLRLTLSNYNELNLFVIPSIRTIKETVPTDLMVDMPSDNVTPTAVFIYKTCGGNPILFRLGKRDRTYFESIEFASCPDEVDVEICSTLTAPNYGEAAAQWYVYNDFYGENYGRRTSRFYGYFSFDAENNRIELIGPAADDVVLIIYRSSDENCKLIPTDVVPMLAYKVLQQYYESTKPGVSREMERGFRIAFNEFKRHRSDNYSYDDYLDALTSEFSNHAR